MEGLLAYAAKVIYVVKYTTTLTSFPVVCAYLVCVLLSSLWRKFVPPLKLRYILVVYNLGCSLVGLITLIGLGSAIIRSGQLYLKETSQTTQTFLYIYYITKYVELLDTIFMILRHKQRQISNLHVYHHTSILLLSDVTYHSYPWVTISIYIAMNSFVHVFMYAYYGISAIDPDKLASWKKLMTQLQITQFFIGMIHSAVGYRYHGFCIYGPIYGFILTSLFLNFYYFAYIKKREKKVEKKTE